MNVKANQIAKSGLTIYDSLVDRPDLYFATRELEQALTPKLVGENLNEKIRTRSKTARSMVCKAIGYPVPQAFRKTQPRFPGQNFDVYVQKSNNLQIWNEALSPSRRYVLIHLDDESVVDRVRVLTGKDLARFDTTGTLTQKSQAASNEPIEHSVLVSKSDTPYAEKFRSSTDPSILPIAALFEKLETIVGQSFTDPGDDQERLRGAEVHRLVCHALGMPNYYDPGDFPDVPDQLVEIKLQTASTVDLGVVVPSSTEKISAVSLYRHCDVRYAIFYASIIDRTVTVNYLVLVNGLDFFKFYRRFGGNTVNSKRQLRLSDSIWD